jgi:hypothetical protein
VGKDGNCQSRETRNTGNPTHVIPHTIVDFETLQNWECFDADTGKDSALEIREYFVPDFSDWKNHDQYREAFERLLRDLKAEDHDVTE